MKGNPDILSEFGVKPEIDPAYEIRKRVDFLKDYLNANPFLNGYVLGISGGIDSTVAAGLCKMAADETGKRFLGLLMPYEKDEHLTDGYAVVRLIGAEAMEICIAPAVDAGNAEMEKLLKTKTAKERLGNRKARQRMIETYDIAAEYGFVVVGTDHATESITGYYTKYGDGGVDINPLKTLDKRQIKQLAASEWPWGAFPEYLINKTPTAGLWETQSDESELGFSYDALCDYLEGRDTPDEIVGRIETLYRRSWHKRNLPGS